MYHILLTIFLVQATYSDLYHEGKMLLDKGDINGAEAVLNKVSLVER